MTSDNQGAPARATPRKSVLVMLWASAILLVCLLAGLNLGLGSLNQDEGWYLYAARLVAEGQRPYIDFASTQGPVMAYVYAAGYALVEHWGVAGGRLMTALLGLAASAAAAWLGWRMAPVSRRHTTAFVAFTLTGINVYQSYFTTIVKTYALAACLLTLAMVALSYWRSRGGRTAALGAGVLMALACGTRLSAGAAFPAALLALVWSAGRRGGEPFGWRPRWRAAEGQTALALTVGFMLTMAALFLPFAVRAPQALWFALVDYHAGRQAGGWVQALAYKGGFVSRVTQAYFVALALGLMAIALPRCRKGEVPDVPLPSDSEERDVVFAAALLAVLFVTLIHLSTPFPYDDYQAMAYPLLAAVVAAGFLRRLPVRSASTSAGSASGFDVRLGLVVLLLCTAASFSSPINQDWFLARRDRIWWPLKTESPLRRLRRAGRMIRDLAHERQGSMLLTQDPYLAVESGLRMPQGMVLGPFSYFPDWPREKAEVRHVMNRAMLLETLASAPASVAAFSGYGLALRAPEVLPLTEAEQAELRAALDQGYRPVARIDNFGQAETTLNIYVRRTEAETDED